MSVDDKVVFIEDNYKGAVWDTDAIKGSTELIDSGFIIEKSICEFYKDFKEHNANISVKVFLENTTKVGPSMQGSLKWIEDVIVEHDMQDVYGIVYDTEHHFAVTGEWLEECKIKLLKDKFDIIVHLNTVPSDVVPGSKKDSHSFTTIQECSQHSLEYYQQYINMLESYSIPWVREVKEETMEREWKQLEALK